MSIGNLSPREDGLLEYRRWLWDLATELGPINQNPELFEVAWDMEYIPTIPNDKNRYQDGVDLRASYVRNSRARSLPPIGKCTMLEFLIGLAIRLNEADYDPEMPNRAGPWFWALIDNLGIIEANRPRIEEAFTKINTRNYSSDGYGGLFPLRNPKEDQRKVEVWYQMQAYLMENLVL